MLSGIILALFVMSACQQKKEEAKTIPNANPNMHVATVLEVIQTSQYTYLNVFENDHETWIAVPKREAKKGDTVYFLSGMEMRNFESKELGRTFDLVYFVETISDQPIPAQNPAQNQQQPQQQAQTPGRQEPVADENIKVEPAANGVTIAHIFSKKESYQGKSIIVKGKVVKYNPGIMNKNWVHIQDGTKDGNDFDLTITTLDEVKVGDVVTFKGTVALNRDFGYGYAYDVIMEDAKLVK